MFEDNDDSDSESDAEYDYDDAESGEEENECNAANATTSKPTNPPKPTKPTKPTTTERESRAQKSKTCCLKLLAIARVPENLKVAKQAAKEAVGALKVDALPGERAATACLAFSQKMMELAGYNPIDDADLFQWSRPALWARLSGSTATSISIIISKCAAAGPAH